MTTRKELSDSEKPDDGPCFDPTCPCCSTHTKLERRYEDALDAIKVLNDKIVSRCWGTVKTNLTIKAIKGYGDRIKQHLRRAGR